MKNKEDGKERNLQPTCNQLATDCISRQALCEYALNQKDKSVTPNDIMRFPSAQPEIRTCIYEGKLAIWHRWVEINDIDKPIRAMVETYDGRIHFVMPWNIQFINTEMVINNLTKGESNDRN